MNKLDIGLKVSINSYILEVRNHISVMNDLLNEYYDNWRLSTTIQLEKYYRAQIKQLQAIIEQHNNLINTLENFIEQYNNLINTLENFKEKGAELND